MNTLSLQQKIEQAQYIWHSLLQHTRATVDISSHEPDPTERVQESDYEERSHKNKRKNPTPVRPPKAHPQSKNHSYIEVVIPVRPLSLTPLSASPIILQEGERIQAPSGLDPPADKPLSFYISSSSTEADFSDDEATPIEGVISSETDESIDHSQEIKNDRRRKLPKRVTKKHIRGILPFSYLSKLSTAAMKRTQEPIQERRSVTSRFAGQNNVRLMDRDNDIDLGAAVHMLGDSESSGAEFGIDDFVVSKYATANHSSPPDVSRMVRRNLGPAGTIIRRVHRNHYRHHRRENKLNTTNPLAVVGATRKTRKDIHCEPFLQPPLLPEDSLYLFYKDIWMSSSGIPNETSRTIESDNGLVMQDDICIELVPELVTQVFADKSTYSIYDSIMRRIGYWIGTEFRLSTGRPIFSVLRRIYESMSDHDAYPQKIMDKIFVALKNKDMVLAKRHLGLLTHIACWAIFTANFDYMSHLPDDNKERENAIAIFQAFDSIKVLDALCRCLAAWHICCMDKVPSFTSSSTKDEKYALEDAWLCFSFVCVQQPGHDSFASADAWSLFTAAFVNDGNHSNAISNTSTLVYACDGYQSEIPVDAYLAETRWQLTFLFLQCSHILRISSYRPRPESIWRFLNLSATIKAHATMEQSLPLLSEQGTAQLFKRVLFLIASWRITIEEDVIKTLRDLFFARRFLPLSIDPPFSLVSFMAQNNGQIITSPAGGIFTMFMTILQNYLTSKPSVAVVTRLMPTSLASVSHYWGTLQCLVMLATLSRYISEPLHYLKLLEHAPSLLHTSETAQAVLEFLEYTLLHESIQPEEERQLFKFAALQMLRVAKALSGNDVAEKVVVHTLKFLQTVLSRSQSKSLLFQYIVVPHLMSDFSSLLQRRNVRFSLLPVIRTVVHHHLNTSRVTSQAPPPTPDASVDPSDDSQDFGMLDWTIDDASLKRDIQKTLHDTLAPILDEIILLESAYSASFENLVFLEATKLTASLMYTLESTLPEIAYQALTRKHGNPAWLSRLVPNSACITRTIGYMTQLMCEGSSTLMMNDQKLVEAFTLAVFDRQLTLVHIRLLQQMHISVFADPSVFNRVNFSAYEPWFDSLNFAQFHRLSAVRDFLQQLCLQCDHNVQFQPRLYLLLTSVCNHLKFLVLVPEYRADAVYGEFIVNMVDMIVEYCGTMLKSMSPGRTAPKSVQWFWTDFDSNKDRISQRIFRQRWEVLTSLELRGRDDLSTLTNFFKHNFVTLRLSDLEQKSGWDIMSEICRVFWYTPGNSAIWRHELSSLRLLIVSKFLDSYLKLWKLNSIYWELAIISLCFLSTLYENLEAKCNSLKSDQQTLAKRDLAIELQTVDVLAFRLWNHTQMTLTPHSSYSQLRVASNLLLLLVAVAKTSSVIYTNGDTSVPLLFHIRDRSNMDFFYGSVMRVACAFLSVDAPELAIYPTAFEPFPCSSLDCANSDTHVLHIEQISSTFSSVHHDLRSVQRDFLSSVLRVCSHIFWLDEPYRSPLQALLPRLYRGAQRNMNTQVTFQMFLIDLGRAGEMFSGIHNLVI